MGNTKCCESISDQKNFYQSCMQNCSEQYKHLLVSLQQQKGLQSYNADKKQEGENSQKRERKVFILGNWTDNQSKSGKGIIFQDEKSYYQGQIYEGKAAGQGQIYWKSYDHYEGQFKDNLADGKGQIHFNLTNTSLKGIWQNGKPKFDSEMEYCYSKGKTYRFSFLKTPQNIDNQNRQVPQNKNFKKIRIELQNGAIYQGQVKDVDMLFTIDGQGMLHFQDGSYYEGSFKNGKKEGKGKFYWSQTKDYFEGQYKNDEKNGEGIYYYANGDQKKGVWVDGILSENHQEDQRE